jgi:hypothetical protein
MQLQEISGSKSPLFPRQCSAKCGAVVFKVRQKYCEPCGIERRRESMRAVAERQRLRKGIALVKGVEFKCGDCGIAFVRFSIRTTRCKPCQATVYTNRARASSAAARQDPVRIARNREWWKEKRLKDPAYRVTAHCRTLMHRALSKGKAGKSWRTFVDYSLEELMLHLERQFVKGMTWDNYGSRWHIDHIVPRSSFVYASADDPEFRAAWALTNLRPLWAADNWSKHARRTHLI